MRGLEKIVRAAWDAVYPPVCALCGAAGAEPVCAACGETLAWIRGPACRRCGAAVRGEGAACGECRGREFLFDAASAAGMYVGGVRDLILQLKFRRHGYLAPWLAERMAERLRLSGWIDEADLVVPVPAHHFRRLVRGIDAAERLAEEVARAAGRPRVRALLRRGNPPPQSRLSQEERLKRPEGTFRVRGDVRAKRILLVDDVLTTGATANACARALLMAGAQSVVVAVAAR